MRMRNFHSFCLKNTFALPFCGSFSLFFRISYFSLLFFFPSLLLPLPSLFLSSRGLFLLSFLSLSPPYLSLSLSVLSFYLSFSLSLLFSRRLPPIFPLSFLLSKRPLSEDVRHYPHNNHFSHFAFM